MDLADLKLLDAIKALIRKDQTKSGAKAWSSVHSEYKELCINFPGNKYNARKIIQKKHQNHNYIKPGHIFSHQNTS